MFSLNIAEFGPSVYGIKAAAENYFGTHPGNLTLRQSAFLAKLLPSPVKRHDAVDQGAVPTDQAIRIRALLTRMIANGRIAQAEKDEALSQKISFSKSPQTPLIPVPAVSSQMVAPASRPRLKKRSPVENNLIGDRHRRPQL